jgi:hypothetical protein
MSPKKVWSIILIVLGVFLIIGGVSNYYDLNFAQGMLPESDANLTKLYGAKAGTAGSDIWKKVIHREQVISVIKIIFGVITLLIGTLLITRAKPELAFDTEDDFGIDPDKGPSFKF